MRKRENWLFGFAILGAVAAFLKILEYFGITAQPKTGQATPMPVTHPHAGLVWGIGMFVLSIALSGYGFYYANRRQPREAPTNETDEERTARERLYEFFRMCAQDLYRDASNLANSVETKLGSGDDLRGCLAGTLRAYTNRDFRARFT